MNVFDCCGRSIQCGMVYVEYFVGGVDKEGMQVFIV